MNYITKIISSFGCIQARYLYTILNSIQSLSHVVVILLQSLGSGGLRDSEHIRTRHEAEMTAATWNSSNRYRALYCEAPLQLTSQRGNAKSAGQCLPPHLILRP